MFQATGVGYVIIIIIMIIIIIIIVTFTFIAPFPLLSRESTPLPKKVLIQLPYEERGSLILLKMSV